jgi:hypothetical protein
VYYIFRLSLCTSGGKVQLERGEKMEGRIRQSGAGRNLVEDTIRKIIDGNTYGDPMRVLSYTTESLKKIKRELEKSGITIGHVTVGKILDSR